jgi:hypothetical protein
MVKPIIKNNNNVTMSVGIVVIDMYFMCVNRFVPAIAGAKLVVSESGDILSPK